MDTFLVIVKKTTLKWKQYLTTLEQKIPFQSQFEPQTFFGGFSSTRHCSQLQSCAK